MTSHSMLTLDGVEFDFEDGDFSCSLGRWSGGA